MAHDLKAPCLNYVPGSLGKVKAVCQCCGGFSRPVVRNCYGEPDLWQMAEGWSEAPFPVTCRHADGSMGSTYTCPDCNAKLRAGQALQLRSGLFKRSVG